MARSSQNLLISKVRNLAESLLNRARSDKETIRAILERPRRPLGSSLPAVGTVLHATKPPPMATINQRLVMVAKWKCLSRYNATISTISSNNVSSRTTQSWWMWEHRASSNNRSLRTSVGMRPLWKWPPAVWWAVMSGRCFLHFLNNNNSWRMLSTFYSIRVWTWNTHVKCKAAIISSTVIIVMKVSKILLVIGQLSGRTKS